MAFALRDEEWEAVRMLPEQVIVDLAAALDLLIPAELDRRAVLGECVERLVARARGLGLPLSEYDREDLASLAPGQLAQLARLQGVSGPPTVDAVLKAGLIAWRRFEREAPDSPIVMCVPMLLVPIARAASNA